MVHGTNLWQLRADCIRSLGRDAFEGNEQQQQGQIAAHESVRPPRRKSREIASIRLSDNVLAEGSESRQSAKNAA